MASSKNYSKYASSIEYEPQSIYLASGSAYEVMDELISLGTRRILVICTKDVHKYRNVTELIKQFESRGLRTFVYERGNGILRSGDILRGLSVYKEFNCDTIVTVGGSYDIDCGKLISAMAINESKNPSELAGLNNIKKDMSVVCCVVMDNSTAVSMASAEFFDENTKEWMVALSAYLIPQMIVVDTDIAMRTSAALVLDRALTSLGIAIESYVYSSALSEGVYRADAANACLQLFQYIPKLIEDPDDSYCRRQVAVGGIYAGTSERYMGIGLAHLVTHELMSLYRDIPSNIYLEILVKLIENGSSDNRRNAAQLSRILGFADYATSDDDAVAALISRIYQVSALTGAYNVPSMTQADIDKTAIVAVRKSEVYGYYKKVSKLIVDILTEIVGHE